MEHNDQSTTAKAVIFTKPGEVTIESVPVDTTKGTLVRSELIGISHGTEMLFYRGNLPEGIETDDTLSALSGELAYPVKYGYINTGRTDSGGRVFAFYPHQDIFAADPAELVVLPDDLAPEDSVFLASMETAVSIVQDLRPVAGESILILGQGTVGLLVAEILSMSGLYSVISADCFALRRKASSAIGCISIDPESGSAVEEILSVTGGGVDRAVNVSASGPGLQLAIDTLRFEGEVVEASWFGSREIGLLLGSSFHRKRLTVRSSQVSHIGGSLAPRWDKGRRLDFAIGLLEKIGPSKYITHTFALDDAAAAFELLDTSPQETIQVVLQP